MPYIPQERRAVIHTEMENLGIDWAPTNAGDLNYVMSRFVDNFIIENGCRYDKINSMIAALECCKLELYRRLAAPYEDQVLDANGDAYTTVPKREGEY